MHKYLIFSAIVLVSFLKALPTDAQFMITGKVFSNGEKKAPISGVSIINKNSQEKETADSNGNFSIYVHPGDTLSFSHLSFFSYTYFVGNISSSINKNILLSKKSNVISGIVVTSTTLYQKDSIARAKQYGAIFGYEQNQSIMNPITSLYEQFSKKYKDLRKFQSQIVDMEKQKFIDSKYTYEVVNQITKLQGDSAAIFMNTYPMDYNFARTSSALEIKLWVKHNFKTYLASMQTVVNNKVEPQLESPKKK
jgi:hypothetical protein